MNLKQLIRNSHIDKFPIIQYNKINGFSRIKESENYHELYFKTQISDRLL